MKTDLFPLFMELFEDVKAMKEKKHQQAKSYHQRHFGKDTFRPVYFDELKDDFEKLEKLACFFNLLNDDCPLLFVVLDCLGTAKKERQNGQPIEYVQLWLPLVPMVKNLDNCYFINLLKEGVRDEH